MEFGESLVENFKETGGGRPEILWFHAVRCVEMAELSVLDIGNECAHFGEIDFRFFGREIRVEILHARVEKQCVLDHEEHRVEFLVVLFRDYVNVTETRTYDVVHDLLQCLFLESSF